MKGMLQYLECFYSSLIPHPLSLLLWVFRLFLDLQQDGLLHFREI